MSKRDIEGLPASAVVRKLKLSTIVLIMMVNNSKKDSNKSSHEKRSISQNLSFRF